MSPNDAQHKPLVAPLPCRACDVRSPGITSLSNC